MGVINAAELGILKRRLKVIIFSHGFSAHRNSYTCFVKEWASHGYVVLCPEHYEPTLLQGYAQIPKKEGARRLKLIK
jgi:predicted dienelactone hydrolase